MEKTPDTLLLPLVAMRRWIQGKPYPCAECCKDRMCLNAAQRK